MNENVFSNRFHNVDFKFIKSKTEVISSLLTIYFMKRLSFV
jgi:hypothetical protein